MRNTEKCTCLLSTPTVVHRYPTVFFKTLPLLDRNNHSLKDLQESAHWGDWNGTVDQIHLAKDQVHTCQIELLCLIAGKPLRENSSSPMTHKMLHKNQGIVRFVFLRTWECDNQPVSKSFGDRAFQRGNKTITGNGRSNGTAPLTVKILHNSKSSDSILLRHPLS